ncbi:MAG: hypothetical protein JWP51_1553, partial [Bradyrhizobium sp.]|nr:hypothetical protein [Bradyrhizobium sp.]
MEVGTLACFHDLKATGTVSTAGSFLPLGWTTTAMPVLPHFGHRNFSYQSSIIRRPAG